MVSTTTHTVTICDNRLSDRSVHGFVLDQEARCFLEDLILMVDTCTHVVMETVVCVLVVHHNMPVLFIHGNHRMYGGNIEFMSNKYQHILKNK